MNDDAVKVFLDETGRIVIVGFVAWNSAAFVETGRAIPDDWIPLVPGELREKDNRRDQDEAI